MALPVTIGATETGRARTISAVETGVDALREQDYTLTVEDVGLRITTMRDFDGTVWYVTNGSVTELGNRSQGWSVAVVDAPPDLSHNLGQPGSAQRPVVQN